MLKTIALWSPSVGGVFTDYISRLLELKGYKYLEIPSLIDPAIIERCLANTNNRAYLFDDVALLPEATQYIRNMGRNRIGAAKVYYVARCFRAELSTNANRLREFTQVGVEYLGDNPLDCCRDVRKDLLWLMKRLVFEVMADDKQIAGGGPYEDGAGWGIGLERFMNTFSVQLV